MLSTPSKAIRPIIFWKRLSSTLGWTRSSYVLVSVFARRCCSSPSCGGPLVVENLGVIDWSQPLWAQMDWLLLGIFCFMSLLIMAGADLKPMPSSCSSVRSAGWRSEAGARRRSLDLFHARTSALVDHSRVAHRQPFD